MPGSSAVVDLVLEDVVDAVEFLFGNADLFGLSLRQSKVDLRPGRGRGNDEGADERGDDHPAFHVIKPPGPVRVAPGCREA